MRMQSFKFYESRYYIDNFKKQQQFSGFFNTVLIIRKHRNCFCNHYQIKRCEEIKILRTFKPTCIMVNKRYKLYFSVKTLFDERPEIDNANQNTLTL